MTSFQLNMEFGSLFIPALRGVIQNCVMQHVGRLSTDYSAQPVVHRPDFFIFTDSLFKSCFVVCFVLFFISTHPL